MGERLNTQYREHADMKEEDPSYIGKGAAGSSALEKVGIIAGSPLLNANRLL